MAPTLNVAASRLNVMAGAGLNVMAGPRPGHLAVRRQITGSGAR